MAKIYGHASGTIVPQSDFSAGQNENNGWEATQSFRVLKSDIDGFSVQSAFPIGVTLGSLDPNASDFFSWLKLSKIEGVETQEGGWSLIRAKFVGFTTGGGGGNGGGEPAPIPTYSKRGTLYDAPLNEHIKWKSLGEAERRALGKLITGEYGWGPNPFETGGSNFTYIQGDGEAVSALVPDPITSDRGKRFAALITEGKTTFKLASYEYTHRWESNKGIQAAAMNQLGKIATPSGNPPAPGTGRDWMLIGVDEEQLGSGDFRFTNTLTYLLSGEGGHDSFLQSDNDD